MRFGKEFLASCLAAGLLVCGAGFAAGQDEENKELDVAILLAGQEGQMEQLEQVITEIAEAREKLIEKLGKEHPAVDQITAKLRSMMSAVEFFDGHARLHKKSGDQEGDVQAKSHQPQLDAMHEALVKLHLKREELSEKLGNRHPQIIAVQKQADALADQIKTVVVQADSDSVQDADQNERILVEVISDLAEAGQELSAQGEELGEQHRLIIKEFKKAVEQFKEDEAKSALGNAYRVRLQMIDDLIEEEVEIEEEGDDSRKYIEIEIQDEDEEGGKTNPLSRRHLAELRKLKIKELREGNLQEIEEMARDLAETQEKFRIIVTERLAKEREQALEQRKIAEEQHKLAQEQIKKAQEQIQQKLRVQLSPSDEEVGEIKVKLQPNLDQKMRELEKRMSRMEEKLDKVFEKLDKLGDK